MTCAGCNQEFEGAAIGIPSEQDGGELILFAIGHAACWREWGLALDDNGFPYHRTCDEEDDAA